MRRRFPAPWLATLPKLEDIEVAKHPTLDPSVPPIAHCDKTPQPNPYQAVDKQTVRGWFPRPTQAPRTMERVCLAGVLQYPWWMLFVG
jgi:hypothetical protein